jgi:oxygen-independent coproporphyrinogen-3 oxidase
MAFGVYVHWPFCLSKCPYCDFNSHVHDSIDHALWAQSYLKELEHAASLSAGRRVDTVFFGGGTPSLMKPETVAEIVEKIKTLWPVTADLEITLEANPTSVEAEKFRSFREAGVNRVSLGIQAFNAEDLKFLGRTHDTVQARAAIETAANTFDRFSFDLIYARPGQNVAAWQAELSEALKLAVGHLSLYQLTIEQELRFIYSMSAENFGFRDRNWPPICTMRHRRRSKRQDCLRMKSPIMRGPGKSRGII